MNEKINTIYEYLLTWHKKYHILETGSRAIGVANENSDWDFYMCPINPISESLFAQDSNQICESIHGVFLNSYSSGESPKPQNFNNLFFTRYVIESKIIEDNYIKKINVIIENTNNYHKWAQATFYCKKYKALAKNKQQRIKIFQNTFGIEQGISRHYGEIDIQIRN